LTRKFLRIPRFVLRLAGRSLHRVAKALKRRSTSPFRNDGGSKAPVLIIAALDGTKEITYRARVLAFTLTDPSGDQRDPVVCWGKTRQVRGVLISRCFRLEKLFYLTRDSAYQRFDAM
jgi:hypothetical protein